MRQARQHPEVGDEESQKKRPDRRTKDRELDEENVSEGLNTTPARAVTLTLT